MLWDLFLYLISATVMFLFIIFLDQNEIFLTEGASGAFILILLLLGLFGTPFSYTFSFLADNAASGEYLFNKIIRKSLM